MNNRQLGQKLRRLSLDVAGCGFDAYVLRGYRPDWRDNPRARNLYRIAADLQRMADGLDVPPMDTCAWPDALERTA